MSLNGHPLRGRECDAPGFILAVGLWWFVIPYMWKRTDLTGSPGSMDFQSSV